MIAKYLINFSEKGYNTNIVFGKVHKRGQSERRKDRLDSVLLSKGSDLSGTRNRGYVFEREIDKESRGMSRRNGMEWRNYGS